MSACTYTLVAAYSTPGMIWHWRPGRSIASSGTCARDDLQASHSAPSRQPTSGRVDQPLHHAE
jgi:hypothetical protein